MEIYGRYEFTHTNMVCPNQCIQKTRKTNTRIAMFESIPNTSVAMVINSVLIHVE